MVSPRKSWPSLAVGWPSSSKRNPHIFFNVVASSFPESLDEDLDMLEFSSLESLIELWDEEDPLNGLKEVEVCFRRLFGLYVNILIDSAARYDLSSVCVLGMGERSLFGVACWVRFLRRWIALEGRKEAEAEEGEAVLIGHWAYVVESFAWLKLWSEQWVLGGNHLSSHLEATASSNFRGRSWFGSIDRAICKHCGRCSPLRAEMLSNRANSSICLRGYKGNGA